MGIDPCETQELEDLKKDVAPEQVLDELESRADNNKPPVTNSSKKNSKDSKR